jgi:hypothetical protein
LKLDFSPHYHPTKHADFWFRRYPNNPRVPQAATEYSRKS